MKRLIYFTLIIVLVGIIPSCTTYTPNAGKSLNVAFLYNPNYLGFNPKLVAWHISPQKTRVYYTLHKNDLMYVNQENVLTGAVRIKYNLYNTKTNTICDSSNVIHFITATENDTLIRYFDINTPDSTAYLLDVTISDANKQMGRRMFYDINRKYPINTQDYLMVNTKNAPYFTNIVTETDTFIFKHATKKLWVQRISKASTNYGFPYPPHTLIIEKAFTYNPDSTSRELIYDTTKFTLPYEGFMHFRQDTGFFGGYAVFHYHNNFPEPQTPYRLMQPIRYLTTNKEFDELLLYANKKNSVDKFWLEE